MADLESLDDVPAPAANAALVRDALNTTYENRVVIPVDITGATGVMLLTYDESDGEAKVAAMVPTLASVNATDAGRVWVANGAYYEDKLVKVVLIGSGPPSSGDGWDGAYWLDLNTMKEYGPKGTDADGSANPGVWDTTDEGVGRSTKAALATMPYFFDTVKPSTKSNATPYAATFTERMTVSGTERALGTWTTDANGVVVPEDGIYEATWRIGMFVGGATTVEIYPLINGAVVSPQTRESFTQTAGFLNAAVAWGRVSMSAGDSFGIDLKCTAGTVYFGSTDGAAGYPDVGAFEIKRVG